MENHPELAIDLDRLIASKRGGKTLPRPISALLKRFLRLDYINGYLVQGYEGLEWCRKCLEYMDVKVEVEGMDNLSLLPEGARCIMASNHPLGGVDGVALLAVLSGHFGDNVAMLVNDFLMQIKPIASVSIPVSKTGGQSRDLRARVDAMFASDKQILLFPAGICSRKIDGVIQDFPWRKTFINGCKASGRYVVPVHFIGENSKRFYRVDALRNRLHIKANIAMAFLPDELYRARGKTFRAVIGRPIPPETFDDSRTPFQWAQEVRKTVYSL